MTAYAITYQVGGNDVGPIHIWAGATEPRGHYYPERVAACGATLPTTALVDDRQHFQYQRLLDGPTLIALLNPDARLVAKREGWMDIPKCLGCWAYAKGGPEADPTRTIMAIARTIGGGPVDWELAATDPIYSAVVKMAEPERRFRMVRDLWRRGFREASWGHGRECNITTTRVEGTGCSCVFGDLNAAFEGGD